jgi:ABC-type nitrate/sulfonate/bicarbonate transport system ATPase subunit
MNTKEPTQVKSGETINQETVEQYLNAFMNNKLMAWRHVLHNIEIDGNLNSSEKTELTRQLIGRGRDRWIV